MSFSGLSEVERCERDGRLRSPANVMHQVRGMSPEKRVDRWRRNGTMAQDPRIASDLRQPLVQGTIEADTTFEIVENYRELWNFIRNVAPKATCGFQFLLE